ncbi:hypothetical protein IQ238_02810 [Pleurocapsales cyanobacterium LEGE 06147]|nr:hypothetical protein [Pleurocapsales cyanobacterium LEGE 06147]
MERGLLWLPLLAAFIWLAWTGWQEYQKIEAYRIWSEQFDKAKYDIYAVLGQKEAEITWGKPTRKGPVDLKTFSLKDVQAIRLLVGDRAIDWDNPPAKGKTCLEFSLVEQSNSIQIPFTDSSLAAKWGKYLQQEWEKYRLK